MIEILKIIEHVLAIAAFTGFTLVGILITLDVLWRNE